MPGKPAEVFPRLSSLAAVLRGNLGYLASADPVPAIEVSPRRWGTRHVGSEYVGLTSPWSGFRAGPGKLTGLMRQGGPEMHVLPQPAPFDARAAVPQPLGLVGQHRSRRTGDGSEFASIWPYRPGDRLRRVNWRVSARTGDLHVVSSLAEEDAGDAEWIWILHDDSTPAPDALEHLLAAAAEHPEADLLGPKLREWPSLRRLLEVGVTISGTGRRETGLERGEYDQGQHDDVRRVLAVNSAGLLVRREALVPPPPFSRPRGRRGSHISPSPITSGEGAGG